MEFIPCITPDIDSVGRCCNELPRFILSGWEWNKDPTGGLNLISQALRGAHGALISSESDLSSQQRTKLCASSPQP